MKSGITSKVFRGQRCPGPWRVPLASGSLLLAFTLTARIALGQGFATNTYTVSTEDFANPERGFYIQVDSYASAPSAVPSTLANYRINGKSSPGNTYTARISLLLRLFYLDTFVDAPISVSFLNAIQADFDSIRAQGCKAVVRFAYNKDQIRPFAEPSKPRILSHIDQLKPLFKRNADVIAVLQQGLIGAWGEGYYTDVFYTGGQATVQNWNDRIEILNALLAALPAERMIQVRIPQIKQKFVYGPTAPTSSAPLSPAQAFSGSGPARIGFHNDCYLADSTDMGTFSDYDYGGGTSAQDIINLRNYLALETRFTPMGGETCVVNPPTDDCASAGGGADTDMAFAHYSFLNQSYNANVNNDWVVQGCIEEIKLRLGYRLQLVSARFRTEAQPGQALPLTLEFQNAGFAAPYNPRGLELVLRHTVSGQKFFAELSRDTDVRWWSPGTNHVLNTQLALPPDLPTGSYQVLLNLPDAAPSLYAMIPYSVRLANVNALSGGGTVLGTVWEPATGYHDLRQTLTINTTATNSLPIGTDIPLLSFSAVAETFATWQTRHFPSDPGAAAPEADPDLDGRPNFIEYALGSNPLAVQEQSEMNLGFDRDGFLLSLTKGPGAGKDVRYEVQSSPNLTSGSWSNSLITLLETNAARIRVRYDGSPASGFLRVKFTFVP